MHATWPDNRAKDITERIKQGLHPERPRYSLLSANAFSNAWNNGYLPDDAEIVDDLNATGPEEFVATLPDFDTPPNFIIVPCGASAREADLLWDLRRRVGPEPVIATWLWDNHCNPLGNLRCAFASDLVFFSHKYAHEGAFNLCQPFSSLSMHVPACTAQWSHRQAREYFDKCLRRPRKHKLIINYVLYPAYSETRRRVLVGYREHLRNADVFLMPPGDRSRYAGLGREDRFGEWAGYKATVIVPLENDLSTRVFDALLAGLVLIVPNSIRDFDEIIPRELQDSLGIIRTDSIEIDDMNQLSEAALELFDRMGPEGALFRHNFALENHMLVNRVASMLAVFWLIGTGQQRISFVSGPHGPALYRETPAQTSPPCSDPAL